MMPGMVRNLWLGSVVVALVLGVVHAQVTEERVTFAQLVGKVEIRSPKGGSWRPARAGMRVRMGWDIRTYVESTAELKFATGSVIRVDENTVVTVSKALVDKSAGGESETGMKVSTGKIWANVKKLTNTKSKFDFETPTAVASIRGTRLGIDVRGGGTSIDVYEGLVMVRPRGGGEDVPVSTRTRAVVTAGSRDVELHNFEEGDSASGDQPPMVDPFADSTGVDSTDVDSTGADSTVADSAAADSAGGTEGAGADSSAAAPDSTAGASTDSIGTRRDSSRVDSAGAESGPVGAPSLRITAPLENAVVDQTPVRVEGRTTPGAVVRVGGSDAGVGADGSFSATVDLERGANALSVSASLDGRETTRELNLEYRPALFLNISNVVDNMDVTSPELQLEIEVTEGASFSVDGRSGETEVSLEEGRNVIEVVAWDEWDNRVERALAVNYRPGMSLVMTITSPRDGETITEPMIAVGGTATPGAEVEVNGIAVPAAGGSFNHRVPIPDEPQEYFLDFTASLAGEEVTESRTVVYEPEREELSLTVTSPADGEQITRKLVRIAGETAPGARVTVNGRRATVSPSGVISMEIRFAESDIGEYSLDIAAENDIDEEVKTMVLEVDGTSPEINTSPPQLTVQGHGTPATKRGEFLVQALDRTPGDRVTVEIEHNGTTDEYTLNPGGRETIRLEEGRNDYTIAGRDRAGNRSNVVSGKIYYLPGPLEIDILEPGDNPFVIDDLPPMPRGAAGPRMQLEVEIDDRINDVPETIEYCKIVGQGISMVLKDNEDYGFSGTIDLARGANTFTIVAEDIAGNTVSERLEIRIEN